MTPTTNKPSTHTTPMPLNTRNKQVKPTRGHSRYRRGSRNIYPMTPTQNQNQNQTQNQTTFQSTSLPTPLLTRSHERGKGTDQHATGITGKPRHVYWEDFTIRVGGKGKGEREGEERGRFRGGYGFVGGEIGRIRREYDEFFWGGGEGRDEGGSEGENQAEEVGGLKRVNEGKGKAGEEGVRNAVVEVSSGSQTPQTHQGYRNPALEMLGMQTRETPAKTPVQKTVSPQVDPKKDSPNESEQEMQIREIPEKTPVMPKVTVQVQTVKASSPKESAIAKGQQDTGMKSGDESGEEEEVAKGLEEIQRILRKLEEQVCRIKEQGLELESLRI